MNQAHPDIIRFPSRPASVADTPPPVLVLSADPVVAEQLVQAVAAAGSAARSIGTVDAALQLMQVTPPDVCLVGPLAAADTAGVLAAAIQQRGWSTQLLCVQSDASSDSTSLLSTTLGIELIAWPCPTGQLALQLTAAVQRARMSGEIRRLKRQLSNRNLRDMVGHSPAMQVLRQQVQHAADHSEPMLLCGEPGSGVDQVAQAIHDASRRAHRPFVTIDCSVHSAETLETELFGTATAGGGFASARQPGRLEQADGGTLLLEDVQSIALPLQKQLVQIFQDQRFEHPTTGERIRFDVRIVFATPVDLDALVERGLFRADLLKDAGQNRIEIPTLRSRPEDIAALAEQALRKQAAREGRPARSLTMDALHLLQSYAWPGNVRELEAVIERACLLDSGRKLNATMLEPWLTNATETDVPTGMTLADMERRLIEATFNRFAGNREKTAKALQIGIRTLSGKLREYGYPPRGGPGSNIKPWTPADAADSDRTSEQRAA